MLLPFQGKGELPPDVGDHFGSVAVYAPGGAVSFVRRGSWRSSGNARHGAPCRLRVTGVLPQGDIVRHMRALPHAEVAAAVEAVRMSESTAPAIKLAFEFFGADRGAVRLATWDEMDVAGRLWTLSAERMKAKREHRGPLSAGRWRFSRPRGHSATASSCSRCGAGGRSRRRRCRRCSGCTGPGPLPAASGCRSAILERLRVPGNPGTLFQGRTGGVAPLICDW